MRRLSFIVYFFLAAVLYAQSPHGKNLKMDCSVCHNSKNWIVNNDEVKFDHSKTEFPLSGQHEAVSCRMCHTTLKFSESKTQCYDCHKDIHENTVGPDCERCHETSSWLVTNINELHQAGRFPLLGKHLAAQCDQCHLQYDKIQFPVQGVRCFDCHSADYYAAKSPDHTAGNFSYECQDCHNFADARWNMTQFAHDFFPLIGGHNIKNCFSCHAQNRFTGLSKECISCHQTNYESAKNPDHVANNFPVKCENCHNINSWQPASFDHNLTSFPLTGAHINQQCSTCHQNGYAAISSECYSCHKTNYDNSQNPNHIAAGFPTSCQSCHSTTAWSPASFDHNTTKFPLTGAHTNVQCSTCHQNGYANISTDCYSCHKSKYDNTSNPNHVAAGFSIDCQACHTTTAWQPATLNHDDQYFPIYSGAHNGKWNVCADCHTNNSIYAVFSCTTCHEHNQTDMDSHHQGVQGYVYSSDGCFSCHPKGTSEGSFNHAKSVFPLTGAHTTVDCASCHTNGYAGTPTNCVSCHQSNYNNTSNPNHIALALSTDCSTCHTTNAGWKPAQFPVHSNYFTFTGAHTTIANNCAGCHNGIYTNTPKTCVGCHQSNYNSTSNPSHTALSISTDCSSCHTTNAGWKPAQFPIHNNFFALTGAHANISTDCASCHNGNFSNTPITCVGCHQENYNSTTNPNHTSLAISTDCSICHNTDAGWKPALFPMHNNYFALTGAHTTLSCTNCHNGNYNSMPNTCVGCHQADYNNTTNPQHSSAGFPTDCQSCHNTTAWQPSTFNHDALYFPIYSGRHRNRWTLCSDCHQVASNYAVHSCNTSCHKNDHHQDQDCYTCHPTGNGDIIKLLPRIEK